MRFGGIVLAAALTLSACSSDPAPKEPTAAPSTPSATPTRAVPTMPPQASEDSPEGAAAFVKHYVDVFNYAAATGDVKELSRLSSPDCDGCQSYIIRFKQIYDAGDRIAVQLWTLPADGELLVSGATEVVAEMRVDEGQMRPYKFNFILPPHAPFLIQRISFEADA